MPYLPDTTFARGSKSKSYEELEVPRCSGTFSSTSPCLNSCSQSGTPCKSSLCNSSSSSFLFGFLISADSCDGSLRADSLVLSLLLVAGIYLSVVYCDEDVGEVGEDEVEDLVDKPSTTNDT